MSFTLKNYQQRVLDTVDDYLRECRFSNPAAAYEKIARRKDENGNLENRYSRDGYKVTEGLDDCPHVCLRVPTGGGKTYLAALSLRYAARFMETETPTVLWFTPSDAIRSQTVEMLNNPNHPCRQALNDDFGMMTQICDIENFANLRPQDFTDKASIIVSTAQMFRVNETATTPKGRMTRATRKIYATNEALEPHFAQLLPPEASPQLERDDNGEVKLSFANLLFLLRPVVVLDEAHGFVSDLSKKVLQRINPSCVIEWTATPREKSDGKMLHNVLASIGAEELHDEEMIKLPVRVTRHTDWEKAVNGAVNERKRLAQQAKESNDPVRPIILYKAQNKNADVPVARLKQHLIEVEGIAEKAIAIATGEIKEIAGINLLDSNCEIEHIITVEALKEGWDCPFAYILCSIDNVHSTTAIEQLLGRVLRMPFAKRRKHAALNCGYAHVPADSFVDAARSLREIMATGLGFEEEEVRWSVVQENLEFGEFRAGEEEGIFQLESLPDFSELPEAELEAVENAIEIIQPDPAEKGAGGVKIRIKEAISPAIQNRIVNSMPKETKEEGKTKIASFNTVLMKRQSPAEKGEKFAPLAQLTFILPDSNEPVIVSTDSLYEAAEWNDLGDDCLIKGFSIKEDAETFEIKLENGKVVHRKTAGYQVPILPDTGYAMGETVLAAWLEKEIRESSGRYFTETLKEFVGKNIQALLAEITLAQLVRAKYVLVAAMKQWLDQHAERVMEKTRQQMLFDNQALDCEFGFTFNQHGYDPGEQLYAGNHLFKKHYYGSIGKIDNDEEEYCAIVLDGMKQVRHWVRNMPLKSNSFSLPLSPKNAFYPDFVAELVNGKILVVEYKGAFLWADSKLKRQIGELWERRSKGENFFLMASRRDGFPDVETQIKNKISEILD